MGKVSTKANKSVYQLAREGLHLSREEATTYVQGSDIFLGMDGVSESRLVKIENGTATVQPEDVVAMAKRYNKPELRNYYCCNECAIGKLDAPKVTYDDGIYEILVKMVVALENANHEKIRLMEILEDGKVDSSEEKDYRKINEELEHISMTIEALQLWCEKMKLNYKK